MSKSQVFVAQFLSYLPKRFTHLWTALYGRTPYWCAVLVDQYGGRKSTKTPGVHFSYNSSFFSLENAHMCAQTYLLIIEMVILLKIKRRDFFSTRQYSYSLPILVSRTVKTRKFKLLYFRNETCCGIGRFFLVIFNLVYIAIRKTSLFWLYNLMTSLWKPSTAKPVLTGHRIKRTPSIKRTVAEVPKFYSLIYLKWNLY